MVSGWRDCLHGGQTLQFTVYSGHYDNQAGTLLYTLIALHHFVMIRDQENGWKERERKLIEVKNVENKLGLYWPKLSSNWN